MLNNLRSLTYWKMVCTTLSKVSLDMEKLKKKKDNF